MQAGACEFVTCQNEGTCVSTNSSHFTCLCPVGYSGNTCGDIIDLCQVIEPCVNGACTTTNSAMCYTCSCYPGYTGHNCSEHVCEETDCHHGVCVFTEGNGTSCVCNTGFTGPFCETEIDYCQEECSGNGNCTFNISSSSDAKGYCECLPEWTGDQCETKVSYCVGDPCANGGTCTEGDGVAICECAPGLTGAYCESNTSVSACKETVCLNGGTCIDGCSREGRCLNNTHHCICAIGFTGDKCHEDNPSINFCKQDSCANSGTCVEGHGQQISCLCTQDFTGDRCADPVTKNRNDSVSEPLFFNDGIIITIICAATVVIIVGMVGSFIAIVMIARYRIRVKRDIYLK